MDGIGTGKDYFSKPTASRVPLQAETPQAVSLCSDPSLTKATLVRGVDNPALPLNERVKQYLMPSKELKATLEQQQGDARFHLGDIPAVFQNAKPSISARELDWLASELKQHNDLQGFLSSLDAKPRKKSLPNLKFSFMRYAQANAPAKSKEMKRLIQEGTLTIALLGEGTSGKAYKLGLKGQEFAFKVFKNDDEVHHEILVGSRLTAIPIKDCSRLYAASLKEPWTLMEFIDASKTKKVLMANRSGETFEEHNIIISDSGDKNRVHGIQIDHGIALNLGSVGYYYRGEYHPFPPERRDVIRERNALKRNAVKRGKSMSTLSSQRSSVVLEKQNSQSSQASRPASEWFEANSLGSSAAHTGNVTPASGSQTPTSRTQVRSRMTDLVMQRASMLVQKGSNSSLSDDYSPVDPPTLEKRLAAIPMTQSPSTELVLNAGESARQNRGQS